MASLFREDRDLPRARRAVTFVRTRWGVSDPRRSGSGAASGGGVGGVAHAPSSLSTIIRAASAAAENAAAFSMTARAQPVVRQRVAISVSTARRSRQHRRPAAQFSDLKGTTQIRGLVPPFCPLVSVCEAAIN